MPLTALPITMSKLPLTDDGDPVPHVAAWSSERWAVIRFDSLVEMPALFTKGRQGRGVPAVDVMDPARQRRAMVDRRCRWCDGLLVGAGYVPLSATLQEALPTGEPVVVDPPMCRMCGEWTLAQHPNLDDGGDDALVRLVATRQHIELLNPLTAPTPHAVRFGYDDTVERERLERIARRTNGVVGYVRLVVDDSTRVVG